MVVDRVVGRVEDVAMELGSVGMGAFLRGCSDVDSE